MYEELYKMTSLKPSELCVNPFCLNYKLPDELGLCNDCFNNLTRIIGRKKIYDYSGKKPVLTITMKEVLEALIERGEGGTSLMRVKLCYDLCEKCLNAQNEETENRKINSSNRQKR